MSTSLFPPNALRAVLARIAQASAMLRRSWVCFSHAGITMGPGVTIDPGVEFKITDGGGLDLESEVSVSRGVSIAVQGGKISIGARTFVGPWTTIVARQEISIGSDCLIAERVTIRDQDHQIHGDPLTPIRNSGLQSLAILIGKDVWIGAGAVLLKGVVIGDGAVIAANAVVRTNVPSLGIVAGVPARLVASRREGVR